MKKKGRQKKELNPPIRKSTHLKRSVRTEILAEVWSAGRSFQFLLGKQGVLASYGSYDGFIDQECEEDKRSNDGKAILHHLGKASMALAASLWRRELYLSIELINRVLFDEARHGAADLPAQFLEVLKAHEVPASGFIVYPLHSFGVLGLGLWDFFKKGRPDILIAPAKLAVCAQTNNLDASVAFFERSIRDLGMVRTIDRTLISHYFLSRSLEWLEKNPLLLVSLTSLSSGYYDNQFIYILKLKLSTTLLLMLNSLGNASPVDARLAIGSTARTNNWQTLDIHHYLVFQPKVSDPKSFEVQCVPMHAASLVLAELSDLPAEIDPQAWATERAGKRLESVRAALKTLEAGYLEYCIIGNRASLRSSIFRKLIDSIDYFRRAHSAAAQEGEQIVALAIAFEALLMDSDSKDLTRKLHARVKAALKGVKGVRRYRQAVIDLFLARGGIVHQGRTITAVDHLFVRRAYIECLISVAGRLVHLPTKGDFPLGRILGVVT